MQTDAFNRTPLSAYCANLPWLSKRKKRKMEDALQPFLHQPLQTPRPATGVSRARSVPRVSFGVSLGPFGPGLQSVQKVSRVSLECQKGTRTLRGHSQDTFWTLQRSGPEGPQKHPEAHSWDTSGAKGLRDSCSKPGGFANQPL